MQLQLLAVIHVLLQPPNMKPRAPLIEGNLYDCHYLPCPQAALSVLPQLTAASSLLSATASPQSPLQLHSGSSRPSSKRKTQSAGPSPCLAQC